MLGVGHRCSLILRKTARSCDGDDSVGETLKKARRSADPSHSRGTGHPTSRGFADSVDFLARGARILVPPTHKDGSVGIKTTRLRPAAASGSVSDYLADVSSCNRAVLPHRLDKMRPRGRRLEPVAEILRLVRHQAVAEFHDAHDVRRHPVIGQHEFAHPEIVAADDAPNSEAFLVRLHEPALLDVAATADALAGLRIVEHCVLAIDVVLGLEIVRVRSVPMALERGQLALIIHRGLPLSRLRFRYAISDWPQGRRWQGLLATSNND